MKFTDETSLHHKFLENMHDAVLILDEYYDVLDNNHVANILYGYSDEEFKNLSLYDIRSEDERDKIASHMATVLERSGGLWETEHRRKNGEVFAVEVSSTPIEINDKKRFYHVVRDISVRKKQEQALKISENRYKQIVEFSPDTIFIHRNDIITFINNAGLKLFGAKNVAQMIGKSLWDLYPPERHAIVRQRNDIMQETGMAVPTIEHIMLRLDGSKVNVEATACVVDYEGEPAFFVTMRDISERKKYERDLQFLGKHDPITGLANRNYFEETLIYSLHLAKNKGQLFAVLFLDIDSFAIFNAAMGHSNGDALLKAIAQRLITLNIPLENIGRFGPQFAIVLNAISSRDDILSFITQVNDVMSPEFQVNEQLIDITVNYGVALYPDDGDNSADLLRNATIAISRAKELGRGAVQFCTAELKALAQTRMNMEHDLRHAVERQEFYLNYQPIVDSKAMHISGFEALIRWQHDGKLINPGQFISLAEDTHMIMPIGKWILQTACKQAKVWQDSFKTFPFVSVNISPIQFRHGGVLELVSRTLLETGIDPRALKIEVTEGALMDDVHKSIEILKAIKDLGVKISIDDFGTGYSSLNYLRHLPIDYLKIDQSFVRDMTTSANDAAIVKTIIDLAHNLNYQPIAEGVETEEQLVALNGLGCHLIQGYYFSKPLDVQSATAYLQKPQLLP